jgi:tRNA(Ile)-lysidine synthase
MSARLLPNLWSDSISLVRPLLHTTRAEILDYVAQRGLQPIIDPSNADATFFRNRLRHELLPILEGYAPGIRTRLQHSAELLAADYALIEQLAGEAWQRCLAERGAGFVGLQRAAFLAEPLALQRAVLRRSAAELRPLQRDVDFVAVERARAAVAGAASGQQDWIAGLSLLIEPERIWVAEWGADLPVTWPQAAAQPIHLEIPAIVQLEAGWRFSLKESIPDLALATNNRDAYQAWLDADAAGEQLMLRRLQPGDRFQPLGMPEESQKLSDLFTNEKLPQRARAAWPLLFAGNQLAWVPGYRLAHPFRLQPSSRRALHAQLMRD